MNEIQVLDQNTIDKIAAGEVVERPSSVVKELVENAIDAGATAVTVEISDGGKKLIRITDNGCGIDFRQVPAAFVRHATSKIRKVEDLENIASLGFRGEALSSIASVSQVELITKTPSALAGTRYLISGGVEELLEETGAPDGTTFLVRNLFFNTPARSKFLKSDTTEAGYISTLMEQLAMSHPEISFKYIQNRQVRLHSSGNFSAKEVIYSIYGREIARSLIEVGCSTDFMTVKGFIGKPEIARGNRSFENYYINGRFVRDKIIAKAIEDGYKGFLMQHKFPFVSLNIEMNGNELDVNVHPSKMEVRFARGPLVYEAICGMIRDALSGKSLIPEVSPGREDHRRSPVFRGKPGSVPEPFETSRREPLPDKSPTTAEESVRKAPPTTAEESVRKAPLTTAEESVRKEPLTRREEPARKERLTRREEPVRKEPLTRKEEPVRKEPFTQREEQLFAGKLAEPVSGMKLPEALTDSKESTGGSETPPVSAEPSPVSAEPLPVSAESKDPAENEESSQGEQLSLFQEQFLDPSSRNHIRMIGQVFDTYYLAQYGDSLFIIDQHAAHEKVYYERFLKRFRERRMESQILCPPIIVTLSMEEEAVLKANRELFEKAGFEIDPFGGREYSIHAAPSDIYLGTEEQLFQEMLDSMSGESFGKDAGEAFTSRLATMACKAAVKGNHRLSAPEAEALLDELMELDNPYHCPHGRPTIIEISRQELERKFKRTV